MDKQHVTIQEVHISQKIKGLPAGTKTVIFEDDERVDRWEVLIVCVPQEGALFLPMRRSFLLKEDAEDFAAHFRPGTRMNWRRWNKEADSPALSKFESEAERQVFCSVVRHSIDEGGVSFRSGDQTLGLAHRILAGMGIYPGCKPIVDFIGENRMSALRDRFKEGWPFVAQMEYCCAHFDRHSMAYVAANCLYAFTMGDAFSAGYLLRDLEDLVSGVEARAVADAKRGRQAGEAGGASSTEKKGQRLEQVLNEMERLRQQRKYASASSAALTRAAVQGCRDNDQSGIWGGVKDVGGYAADCAGELRASIDYRERFLAMFPSEEGRNRR